MLEKDHLSPYVTPTPECVKWARATPACRRVPCTGPLVLYADTVLTYLREECGCKNDQSPARRLLRAYFAVGDETWDEALRSRAYAAVACAVDEAGLKGNAGRSFVKGVAARETNDGAQRQEQGQEEAKEQALGRVLLFALRTENLVTPETPLADPCALTDLGRKTAQECWEAISEES